MAETDLTATEANALHGTTDGDTGFTYHSPGDAEYFTEGQRQRQRLLTLAKALGNKFRVYKDGTNTYGVRPGKVENGDSTLSYAGSTGNALTDNQTNYIWLYIESGALTLDTSTSGFPDPSDTPHIPLATIAVASGSYAYTDIIDCRQLACFSLNSAATAADLNTLVGGSTADSLHTHDAAGLVSGLQDAIPRIDFEGTDDEDGTGSMTIKVLDAAGNQLMQEFLIRTWIADADMSEPDPQTDYSVTSGEQMREIEANADYEVITNDLGYATMNIDAGGAKTVYVMAELDGRIYSQSLAITAA